MAARARPVRLVAPVAAPVCLWSRDERDDAGKARQRAVSTKQ